MSELRGPGRGEGGEPAAEQQVELHVGDVGGEHAHQLRHLHRVRVTCHVSRVAPAPHLPPRAALAQAVLRARGHDGERLWTIICDTLSIFINFI